MGIGIDKLLVFSVAVSEKAERYNPVPQRLHLYTASAVNPFSHNYLQLYDFFH